MNSIDCHKIKANPKEKRDITIVVHDPKTGFNPKLGFSIKSQLGNPSTLLNASKSTNFIYEIENFDINDQIVKKINEINTPSKIRDRIQKIEEMGGHFCFIRTQNKNFGLNLTLIDSSLTKTISEILISYYKGESTSLFDLLNYMIIKNPLNYDLDSDHPFYEYKIKRLLLDIALGMTPTKVWDGYYDASGGYIVVKENGEILCYHIYNINEFQEYLLNNTKLETPSSSRHDFGLIYRKNSKLFFKLNLQIRFIK